VRRIRKVAFGSVAFTVAAALAVWGGPQPDRVVAASSTDPVIAAAGDIACAPGSLPSSTRCQHATTGALLSSIYPNAVLPLGDTQYQEGTSAQYAGSYNKTDWGATWLGASRPAVGNHEYYTAGAAGYYGEFGANAGSPSEGYYSWDVGAWHMIALNSECAQVGGCGAGSPQEQWLKNDLAAHNAVCTMAYWHRPRFSSGSTIGSNSTYQAFWNDLYAAHADVVLAGHAHHYERFAPQTPSGAADDKGIREFIVGTGGEDFQGLGSGIANSEVRNNQTFGVLKMTLHDQSYDWQFVPIPGSSFTDSGSYPCTK